MAVNVVSEIATGYIEDLGSLARLQVTEQGTRHKAQDAVQSAKSSPLPVKGKGSTILGFNHFKVFMVVAVDALNWQINQ